MQNSSNDSKDDVGAGLEKAAIRMIAKQLFGQAILAAVRRNPVLRRTLWEAFFYAFAAATIGHFQFGLPLLTCFFTVLVLYAEAIAQVHYAELYALYCKWTTFRRRAYLTVFLYIVLRFVVWKGFGLPPADAYVELVHAGGFIHLLWYGNAPLLVLQEVALTFLLGTISCLIVFHRHRRAVLSASALVGVAAMFWAMPLTDAELAEKGIVGAVANRLGRLSGATSEELEKKGILGSAYYRTKAFLGSESRTTE
jgi:hypothetical protein